MSQSFEPASATVEMPLSQGPYMNGNGQTNGKTNGHVGKAEQSQINGNGSGHGHEMEEGAMNMLAVAITVLQQALDFVNGLTSDEQLTFQSTYIPGSTIGEHDVIRLQALYSHKCVIQENIYATHATTTSSSSTAPPNPHMHPLRTKSHMIRVYGTRPWSARGQLPSRLYNSR